MANRRRSQTDEASRPRAWAHRLAVWSMIAYMVLPFAIAALSDDSTSGSSSGDIAALILYGVSLLCFAIWFHEAYEAHVDAGGAVFWSPGWAIGGWFIPFANFVLPYWMALDLWKGVKPVRLPTKPWETAKHSTLVHWWWLAFIYRWIGLVVAWGFLRHVESGPITMSEAIAALIGLSATLLFPILSIAFIRTVDASLDRGPSRTPARRSRLRHWTANAKPWQWATASLYAALYLLPMAAIALALPRMIGRPLAHAYMALGSLLLLRSGIRRRWASGILLIVGSAGAFWNLAAFAAKPGNFDLAVNSAAIAIGTVYAVHANAGRLTEPPLHRRRTGQRRFR